MPLVDAHVHLTSYGDGSEVALAARATGTMLISCTVNASEVGAAMSLRSRFPETVVSFLGVHPSDVSETLPSEALAGHLAVADGIGEIGLDSKYSETGRGSLQMKAFVDQLQLAENLGKPVEVHSRGSAEACLDVLDTFRLRSVLMHWFEDEQMLARVDSKGYYVSVGPAILYSKKIRRIAGAVSGNRLLPESDGPVEFKALDGASGPALIPSVVFSLAEARGASFQEQELSLSRNAQAFLGRARLPTAEATGSLI